MQIIPFSTYPLKVVRFVFGVPAFFTRLIRLSDSFSSFLSLHPANSICRGSGVQYTRSQNANIRAQLACSPSHSPG